MTYATKAAISVLYVDKLIMAKPAGGPKPKENKDYDNDDQKKQQQQLQQQLLKKAQINLYLTKRREIIIILREIKKTLTSINSTASIKKGLNSL